MRTNIIPVVTGPFQENSFIVWKESKNECILIDPGDDADQIISKVDTHDLVPKAIINTHAHLDHIGAVDDLKKFYHIPFYLHRDEAMILDGYESSLSYFGLTPKPAPKVDVWFKDEKEIKISKMTIKLFFSPGHTPGGTCLIIDGHVFTGDTLFKGSIGRTDLPGGDYSILSNSLRKLVTEIPESYFIYPGHGPQTTLAVEKRENPYLTQLKV